MLTSKLSLSLIWLYLKKIEALEGPIQDIQISYWSTYNPEKLVSPPDIQTLALFGNYQGFDLKSTFNPYSTTCEVKELYMLRSFVAIPNGRREFFYYTPLGFQTRYSANPITLLNLNGDMIGNAGYLTDFNQLWKEWQTLNEYIDCETTLLHFNASIKKVEWLYKNIRIA